jgi:Fic family protein
MLYPDQAILINAIPLQEAKMSSEIENIVTTQDELFHAALDENSVTNPQTKEVIRYRTALRQGYETLKENPFNIELLETVCGTIHDKDMKFRKHTE